MPFSSSPRRAPLRQFARGRPLAPRICSPLPSKTSAALGPTKSLLSARSQALIARKPVRQSRKSSAAIRAYLLWMRNSVPPTKSENRDFDFETSEKLVNDQRAWLARRLTECGIPKDASGSVPHFVTVDGRRLTSTQCLSDLYGNRIGAISGAPPKANDAVLSSADPRGIRLLYSDNDALKNWGQSGFFLQATLELSPSHHR